MLIFYVDEFGDTCMSTKSDTSSPQLKNGVSRYFILSAVGVRDTSRKPLAEAIFELKRKHFKEDVELLPWRESEVKGRYLFRVARSVATGHVLQAPAAYSRVDTPGRARALIDDVGRLFGRFRPMIFAVTVDKQAALTKQPVRPLGVAYTYLEQRVALTMERLYAGEAAILVADQQAQHETFFRSGEMNATRDNMTKPLPVTPNFNMVLDKPLWIDTELSVWDREILQLPDIVAYSVAELFARGCAPEERCYLWPQIKPHLVTHWSTGNIKSGGLALYPPKGNYPEMEKPAHLV